MCLYTYTLFKFMYMKRAGRITHLLIEKDNLSRKDWARRNGEFFTLQFYII